MLLHQNLKRRDGRAEPGLWGWRTDPSLSLCTSNRERVTPRVSLQEKPWHCFLSSIFPPQHTFSCAILFLYFSPFISPEPSWSLCVSLSKAISPDRPSDCLMQLPCESSLITCGKLSGAHFAPQRGVLTEIRAISYLQDRMEAELLKPVFNAISKQVRSVWTIFSSQENTSKQLSSLRNPHNLGFDEAMLFQSVLLPGLYLPQSQTPNNKAIEPLDRHFSYSSWNLRSDIFNTPCSHLPSKTLLPTPAKFSDEVFSGKGKMKITRSDRFGYRLPLWIQTQIQSGCLSISAHSHSYLHTSLTRTKAAIIPS